MKYIKTFNELGRGDAGIAGGKGASLGEMANADIPVPDGFVVLSDAFEYFIRETDTISEIEATLKKVNHKEMESVERASQVIRDIIENAKMPKNLEKEIFEAHKSLGAEWVAVRSSATAEDGAEHAWAGQLDSFLNTSKDDLIKNVQRCFSSLFTPRAIFYRFEKGLHDTHISVAVVVQKMVQSEKSGIAFSVHPVTEDYNQMIIEASWGLGEAIVSGQVTPDSYVVTKTPKEILDTSIAEKTRGLFKAEDGSNVWKDIDDKKANEQCLSGKEVIELADLIIKIENHYGFPCDIEWAYENKMFYIVQSRPITTLTPIEDSTVKSSKKIIKTNKNKYHFHFKCSDTPLCATELAWTELSGYGKFEYVCFQEGDLLTAYCTSKGVKDQYTFGKENLFSKSKFDKIIGKIRKVDSHLKSFKFRSLHGKDEKKVYKEWLVYFKQCKSLLKELGSIYFVLEQMVIEPLAEQVDKIAAKYNLTQDAILHDSSLIAHATREEKLLIKNFEDLGHWKFRLHQHVEPVLNCVLTMIDFISHTIGMPKNWAMMLRSEDIINIFTHKKIDFAALNKREKGVLFITKNGKVESVSGKRFEKIKSEAEPEFNGEIIGTVAFRGKVQGKATIHLGWISTIEIPKGNILIAGMTNPQMVPFIKHASAIVTDEGGLTCHAAIIAREMKIPCIVGTKVATRVIKDGDLLEVDANTGVVKILNQS